MPHIKKGIKESTKFCTIPLTSDVNCESALGDARRVKPLNIRSIMKDKITFFFKIHFLRQPRISRSKSDIYNQRDPDFSDWSGNERGSFVVVLTAFFQNTA
jgi:hypothetical protein